MDTVDKETRSRVMASVHSKDTKLERILFAALEDAGITGFVCHEPSLPGKPDIVFTDAKVVIFFDSCFWHGCPKHLRKPNSNQDYWQPKIENNIKRDLHNRAKLRRMGWSVLRIWEHDLKNPVAAINRVRRFLDRHRDNANPCSSPH